MSIRDIEYKEDYRSGDDDILIDFFQPSLREAKHYWRAVGYFSSSALEAFGAPLGEFILNDGQIRLVTSVELSKDDIEKINAGTKRESVCATRLERIIDEEFADGIGDGVARLGRLLELNRLEILIAVPKHSTGIYHEKIGLFIDGSDIVAFTGSSNESRNAFENNRECVDVFTSWDSPRRAHRKKAHFEEIWNRTDNGVEVYSFPEAVRNKLLRECSQRNARRGRPRMEEPKVEKQDKRWQHQEEALQKFLEAERGILNMATGTGKTRTALNILRELFKREEIDAAIICTEGNDLLNQWYIEVLAFRRNLKEPLRIFRDYSGFRESQDFVLKPQNAILLVSRRLVASTLRQLSLKEGHRTLLIHDEVHGLGSPGNRRELLGLSDKMRFRLGLSATPEREYDQDGNEFIDQHIGPVLMNFGLREAIERGILAPFKYYPLSFELTDSDRERIAAVYRRQTACALEGKPMSDAELWIAIALVHKTSEAKIPIFERFIEGHKELLKRCIIFTETIEYGRSILNIVHRHRTDFHAYFSGEDADTLRRFVRGELECLVTCHRLSEGIDIHSLDTVILFSSERARLETIQRIGRCLRLNPEDPEKSAHIVDFIRVGGDGDQATADEVRRDWLSEIETILPKE